ncbi:MAG: metal-dependent hydrolase, partial [Campylobacterota bacterium]|nr:metal-dependent hydrolase [Campylobacterota bacterium]
VIASGVIVSALFASSLVGISEALSLLTIGIIGGVLPDLDSSNSKPVQITFRIFSIFLPFIVILTFIKDLPLIYIFAIWLFCSLLLEYFIFALFLKVTRHRGIFHSVPMGVLMGLLLYNSLYLFTDTTKNVAFLSGFMLFYGYIVHLLLDEIVSLNALGMRVKKSFGTAMKLYDKKNLIGTAILYLGIYALIAMNPIHIDRLDAIYNSIITMNLY